MAVASEPVVKQKSEKDKLKEMFPGLCRPDNPAPVSLSEISTYIVAKQGTAITSHSTHTAYGCQ